MEVCASEQGVPAPTGQQVITVSGAQTAAQLTSQQLPKHRCLLPYETPWDTQTTHFGLADMT